MRPTERTVYASKILWLCQQVDGPITAAQLADLLSAAGHKDVDVLSARQIAGELVKAGLLTSSKNPTLGGGGYSLATKKQLSVLDAERAVSKVKPKKKPAKPKSIDLIEQRIVDALDTALDAIKIDSLGK